MEQTATFVRSGDFATRNVAGETILVPIRSGVADLESVYTLDAVGTTIWTALETPKSTDEIVAEIVREFDVTYAEARRDVSEFLETLSEARLVGRSPSSPRPPGHPSLEPTPPPSPPQVGEGWPKAEEGFSPKGGRG